MAQADAPNRSQGRDASRVLFLDDSGKPTASHSSGAVVIGGFAIGSGQVASLSRRLEGAKSRWFPNRGPAASWELKSNATIKPNALKRSANRRIIEETLRILDGLGCTTYSATINKARMRHSMTETTTVPLQLQALAEHFAVECAQRHETGLVVMDRSSAKLDAHATHSVASYVAASDLPLHPALYFADSAAVPGIQAADLIAGIRRRSAEGDVGLHGIDERIGSLRPANLGQMKTHKRHRWTNRITVF